MLKNRVSIYSNAIWNLFITGICYTISKYVFFTGYQYLDMTFGCDLPTTKAILTDLAVFHAIPLGLRLTTPDVFDNTIKPCLQDARNIAPWRTDRYIGSITEVLRESITCLKIIPKIKRLLENSTNNIEHSRNFHTICHNDMWLKNVVVKFVNGNPDKVKFIGHLFHTYDSLAIDIILFFITSVKTSILKTHLDDLLDFYYGKLLHTLKEFKISTAHLSRALFLEEFRICTRRVIGNGLFLLMFVIFGKDSAWGGPFDQPKLNRSEDIPFAAKEKCWWFVSECEKRGWLNV